MPVRQVFSTMGIFWTFLTGVFIGKKGRQALARRAERRYISVRSTHAITLEKNTLNARQISIMATIALLPWTTIATADDHLSVNLESTIHGGIQVIGTLDGTSDLDAFYGEVNTGINLARWPQLTALLDFRGESLAATAADDDRISLYAHVRPGMRLNVPAINNLDVYFEASAANTWEWYRRNGELQDEYPAFHTSPLYAVGVADRYRGAQWRLGGAYDGYQDLAGRSPYQVRGDVHIVEENRNTWGVNGRLGVDYLSLGLSLRLH